jgi:tRNA uridine 5-carboxymethylaminomethyl modification enzyme
MLAGINAVLKIRGEDPLILPRSQAYAGVLIDDLVTKGTNEPYRMFTSRAEYRLLLREDNADFRLRDIGYRLGLVPDDVYHQFNRKRDKVEKLLARLNGFKLKPVPQVVDRLKEIGSAPIKNATTLGQLLKRSEIFFEHLRFFDPELSETEEQVAVEVETRIKYEGYIDRQERQVEKLKRKRQVEKLKRMEGSRIPEDMDYGAVHSFTTEVREKLSKVKPVSLGQASRISGVTPAALMALQVHLKKMGSKNRQLEG